MAGHGGNFFVLDIGRQTAKGTPQTTSKFKLRLTNGIVVPDPQVIDLPETDNSIQRSRSVKVGQVVGGAIEGFVRSDEFSLLAYGALGANNTSGAGPFTHTATGANPGPYFTLYPSYDTTALVDRYADCKISELVLRGGAGQALTYSAAFMGLTAVHGETQPATPSPSAVEPLVYPNVTVTLGGVTTDIVEAFELTSTKVTQTIQGDTGMVASDVVHGRWGVVGFLDVLFETDAKWRSWLTGSAGGTATSQTLFTEALTITASRGASDEIAAVLTAVELRRIGLQPNPTGEPLRFRYEFSAQPQATIANTLSFVTKNSVATL